MVKSEIVANIHSPKRDDDVRELWVDQINVKVGGQLQIGFQVLLKQKQTKMWELVDAMSCNCNAAFLQEV